MKHENNHSTATLKIRPMREIDIEAIAVNRCPAWSNIQKSKDKWNNYYCEQQTSIRTVAIVEQNENILGYGSLLLESKYPYFAGLPEVHDIWIYEEYRKKGIGSRLISWLENLAKEKGHQEIVIGVGLYADYGSAQRLYVRLGYLPDGLGVTYDYQPTVAGQSYPLDDELILWLKKAL